MAGRRILYLAALAGCLVYYYAYPAWLSHLLLLAALCLPWLSLLLSLPAVLTVRFTILVPGDVPMGTPVHAQLEPKCRFPLPPFRCRLRATHRITGQTQVLKADAPVPTGHCGCLELAAHKLRLYDYLGLFSWRHRMAPCRLTVLPKAVEPDRLPALRRYLASSWKPKPGGGFSEHHDLRLYRPGDSLRGIHWKLAAKTGSLIYREPIEPVRETPVIALHLSGTHRQLDRKLGSLAWTMDHFLSNQLPCHVRCLTGNGLEVFSITDKADAASALHSLLASPAADEAEALSADRCFLIGGGPDA